MISWIVRRVIESGYRMQNRGDFDGLSRMFAADGVFEFVGDTPFGGERRGPEAIAGWFRQVEREFGSLTLTTRDVVLSGPPWNIRVIVRFTDRYRLISGDTIENQGFQFLRVCWGKIKEERTLVDLGIVGQAMALVAASRRESLSPEGAQLRS